MLLVLDGTERIVYISVLFCGCCPTALDVFFRSWYGPAVTRTAEERKPKPQAVVPYLALLHPATRVEDR